MKYKTFEKIIEEEKVPNHSAQIELKHGICELPEQVVPVYRQLYRPHGTTKNTGNGEVALYWLFNKKYGGKYDVERPNKSGKADLIIDSISAEVKAWNFSIFERHRIKVGRFERQHDIRRLINVVFGVYNAFYSGKCSGERHGKRSYLSEVSFGMNGLTRAFRSVLEHDYAHISNVADVLEHRIYAGLEDPADFAAKTFAVLAKEKLLKKVGRNNFIINARPDKIGRLEIFQLGDLDNVNLEVIKNEGARVQCSELFLNLEAFARDATLLEKISKEESR